MSNVVSGIAEIGSLASFSPLFCLFPLFPCHSPILIPDTIGSSRYSKSNHRVPSSVPYFGKFSGKKFLDTKAKTRRKSKKGKKRVHWPSASKCFQIHQNFSEAQPTNHLCQFMDCLPSLPSTHRCHLVLIYQPTNLPTLRSFDSLFFSLCNVASREQVVALHSDRSTFEHKVSFAHPRSLVNFRTRHRHPRSNTP